MSHVPTDPASLSRRERERLLRRQAMLTAARDVFAERGYVHATLEEVAERAEFGKGTLYNYFPGGKEELLRSVLDGLFVEIEALLEPFLRAPISDEAAFRHALHDYFRRSAQFFYRNRNLFHLMMREAWRLQLSSVEESRDYLQAQIERSVTALSERIERVIEAGALRPLPPRSLAYIILSSMSNHIAAQEVSGWPADPVTAAEEAASFLSVLLMDGLGARA